MAAIEGQHAVFNPVAQLGHVAGRVSQTVQRAQYNHVQVQIDAAVLLQQSQPDGVAQVDVWRVALIQLSLFFCES